MVFMQPTVFQWFHEFLLHLLQRRIRVSFHLWKMQKLAWPWPLEKQPSLQVHQHRPKGVLKSGTNGHQTLVQFCKPPLDSGDFWRKPSKFYQRAWLYYLQEDNFSIHFLAHSFKFWGDHLAWPAPSGKEINANQSVLNVQLSYISRSTV